MDHTFIPIAMLLLVVALSAFLAGWLGFGRSRRTAPVPPPQPSLRLAVAQDNESDPVALVPCWFHLPTAYNDGRPIAPTALAAITTRIRERFGAHTFTTECRGVWTREEPQIRVEISVPKDRIVELQEFVRAIGGDLGEHFMYFITLTAAATLLPTVHARDDDSDIAKAA